MNLARIREKEENSKIQEVQKNNLLCFFFSPSSLCSRILHIPTYTHTFFRDKKIQLVVNERVSRVAIFAVGEGR